MHIVVSEVKSLNRRSCNKPFLKKASRFMTIHSDIREINVDIQKTKSDDFIAIAETSFYDMRVSSEQIGRNLKKMSHRIFSDLSEQLSHCRGLVR